MIELYGYHIVLTTHNSRTSKRMRKYRVVKGFARNLTLKEEILLTEIIGQIVRENSYQCIAYNICKDHVHLILVCQSRNLTRIIQKLKSISSKIFNRHQEVNKAMTELHRNRLWSQKFFRAALDEWALANLSSKTGEIYSSSYLQNSMAYVKNNRQKHNLPFSPRLNEIIDEFIISIDDAYSTIQFKGS